MSDTERIDVYAVGLFRDVKVYGRRPKLFWRWFMTSWRRKSYWNGYLAEPYYMPEGVHRCGSGWTKKRALRSYAKQLRKAGYR